MEDALNWLRNNDPDLTDLDDATIEAMAKLAGVPLGGAGSSPRQGKTAAVDDALSWLRNNDLDLEDLEDPTLMSRSVHIYINLFECVRTCVLISCLSITCV